MRAKIRGRLPTPWIAAIGAALLVGVLFLSFLFSSGPLRERSTGIMLPEGTEDTPVVSAGSQMLTVQSVADVEISTANARHVIASLSRPKAYSCKIENTLYYMGGSSTLYCNQYIKGDAERVDTTDASNTVRSTLLRVGDTAYSWEAGETHSYKGSWGDFSSDTAAMLPTYEDVLDASITFTKAERVDIGHEPCVMVTFEREGYNCEYYISLTTGLMQSASFRTRDKLVREVKVKALKTEEPDDAVFALPDGEIVLEDNVNE